ncbi:MAG: SH3 domain-containing protein [Clostridia bacterium]|nr:SH3 domain-containing protein [Clostridia bacterium]
MGKRKRRKTSLYKRLFIVFLELIVVLTILRYAAYFKKENDDGKIHLVLDNVEIDNLKNDIFVDDNNIVYLSEDDVKEYFDKSLYEEKKDNDKVKIVSTCLNKVLAIDEGENHIFINGVRVKIKGSLQKKNGEYYLPISELQSVYNIELEFIKDSKRLDIEYLYKAKKTAQINKNTKLKYKMKNLSRSIQDLEQGETVVIVEDMEGSWTRVKTNKGYIGYVKDKNLSNQNSIRDDLGEIKYKVDMESGKIKTLSREDFEDDFENQITTFEQRKEIIDKVVDAAIMNELNGVNVDIGEVKNIENYYRFLRELKPYLQDYGMFLVVSKDGSVDKKIIEKIADDIIEK